MRYDLFLFTTLILLNFKIIFCDPPSLNALDNNFFAAFTLPTNPPAFFVPKAVPTAILPIAAETITPIPSFDANLFTMPTFPTFPTIPPMSMSTMEPVNLTINEEALMTVPEIIAKWGYPVEEHRVETTDGYILLMHRIPFGRANNTNSTGPRPVVFLQHGLLCTSSIWLLNLPHQSAGFIFADQGFDVWLGNMRGNVYSKAHRTLSPQSPDFWKFSWEQMARYDLDSMINYVLNETSQPHLYYVGHSQGVLTMLAKLSIDPPFAKKIRKFFALAPVARMANVQGTFKYLGQIYEQFSVGNAFLNKCYEIASQWLEIDRDNDKRRPGAHEELVYTIFGDNEFMTNNIITRTLTDLMCDKKLNNSICDNFIFSVSGPNTNQFNSSRIGIYLAHNPAGTSSRNMVHFAQMVKSRRFAAYDYGRDENLKIYGKLAPPVYKLNNISTPMYLYYSDSDFLANSGDVEDYLLKQLPKTTVKVKRKLLNFNHNDFLWGLRARKEIYDHMLGTMKLDIRRLNIQKGLKKYFEGGPSNIPPRVSEMLAKQLGNSIEFDS